MSVELALPGPQALESMALPDRIALEGTLEEVLPPLRELNNADIRRLAEAGASQRAIAEACGRTQSWARDRLAVIGLATPRNDRGESRTQALPQTGDEEVVDVEVVEDDGTSGDQEPVPTDDGKDRTRFYGLTVEYGLEQILSATDRLRDRWKDDPKPFSDVRDPAALAERVKDAMRLLERALGALETRGAKK